jgi:CO/xanthine dehydrogenase Mo-binding subunit
MQRRQFLQAGSGLIVSFTWGLSSVSHAQANVPTKSMDKAQVQAWLSVGADGRITVYSGKVDLGTGVRTALMQMVAEELDVNLKQIDMVMGDTLTTLDQGQSAGSLSLQNGGGTLRQAAASARQALLSEAAGRLQVNVADLMVSDGIISTLQGDRKVSYSALVDGAPLNVKLDPKAPLKAYVDHKIVGKSIPRVDIPAKVTGQFLYMHDFKLPGMLHARMIRPSGQGGQLIRSMVSSRSCASKISWRWFARLSGRLLKQHAKSKQNGPRQTPCLNKPSFTTIGAICQWQKTKQ